MKCGNICEQKMKVYSNFVVSAACINANKFLFLSLNPLIRKYLDANEFSKFEIVDGDLEWNDYDLCFPVADLHENRIMN